MKWTLSILICAMLVSCAPKPSDIRNVQHPSLPIRIGSMITTAEASVLVDAYGLEHVKKRIIDMPEAFMPWKFDGCSGLIDGLLGVTGVEWSQITYEACLPHDLEYAYGTQGDELARLEADNRLYDDLIRIGMNHRIAMVFYDMVRRFGGEEFGMPFSWGFARKGVNDAHSIHKEK